MYFKTIIILALISLCKTSIVKFNKSDLKKFVSDSESDIEIIKVDEEDILEIDSESDIEIIEVDDENLFKIFLQKNNVTKNDTEYLQKYFDDYKNEVYQLLVKDGFYTWRIHKFSSYIPDLLVWETMATAFNFWETITQIKFVYSTDTRTNIKIMFTNPIHTMSTGHACVEFEDNTLAHAYYPDTPFFGEMHFNDRQLFDANKNQNSFSLLRVAIHEIGHLLGLRHNDRRSSIMYPYESPNMHHRLNLNMFDWEDKMNFF